MKRLALVGVVGVVLASSGAAIDDGSDKTLTARFASTTSLYEGAKVKVLGVAVGKVESIEVKGTEVEVTMSYDKDLELPADVHALIVPPSIVGDRFVQLAPVYESGPVLADGAGLEQANTGVPMELDEVYSSLDDLTTALGPTGANKDGALSDLITATAENLNGRGALYNQTIREMADAVTTLATSSGDMTGTVENLNTITHTLAGKDRQMRRLVANLVKVATVLNGQTKGIDGAVTSLRTALADVNTFIRANRDELGRTVDDLADVTSILDKHSTTLAKLLDLAPVGITSLGNIYVPQNWDPAHPELTPIGARAGSIAMRTASLEGLDMQMTSALTALCTALPAQQASELAAFCNALRSVGSLGSLITQIGRGELSPSAETLEQLIGGAR
ncbi:MCE family protein [Nocardioides sp. WS12]|uniref:MCE family protein n=1 Tax=Nocardioides sp. WS12 TaxID=2486272 RepID=UPI0015FA4EE0|nr:MCE family protein [Nocardioides sp. WS12]